MASLHQYSLTDIGGDSDHRAIAGWLKTCWMMLAAMIILGGYTRLSGSGLSMVGWSPLGTLPPMSQQDWSLLYQAYQQSPEYQRLEINLDQFKTIFWPEYLHRLWGRLLGLVFFIPWLWFTFRGSLGLRHNLDCAGILILGGLQGLMGWYMVQSGLSGQGMVSHYRLAAHSSLALIIYSLLWIKWLQFSPHRPLSADSMRTRRVAAIATLSVFFTMIIGAFVSGLDGGQVHNTFPWMSGHFFPADAWSLEPWIRNLTDNASLVQFIHRLAALISLISVLFLSSIMVNRHAHIQAISIALWLAIIVVIQVVLGITTVLWGAPWPLALAHQITALILLSLTLWTWYLLGDEGTIFTHLMR